MRKKLGVKNPKKPNRFVKVDTVSRYIFCSNFDDLFNNGVNGMFQVDFVDYGLEWDKLKEGEEGNMVCFEIVDFVASCPKEQAALIRKWERIDRIERARSELRKAKAKMRARIRRIILGNCLKKYYWLPSYTHGRLVLAHLCCIGELSLRSLTARLGLYLVSLVFAQCLPSCESF